jgi:UDP-glucose 4-epimerase
VRDYIHVLDLADAHLLALDFPARNEPRIEIYNLGCGGEATPTARWSRAWRPSTGSESRP